MNSTLRKTTFAAAIFVVGLVIGSFIGSLSFEQRTRFNTRNEIDQYVEFLMASGASIEEVAARVAPNAQPKAICVAETYRVEQFLTESQKNALTELPYFNRFKFEDNIWKLVFLFEDSDPHVFHLYHISIGPLEAGPGPGCYAIGNVAWEVVPPRIEDAGIKSGDLFLQRKN
jgi:hypothetical protein